MNIRFVSELELEHAFVEGLEEAGELELEQAYVDFLLSRRFNVRAGMMLPFGLEGPARTRLRSAERRRSRRAARVPEVALTTNGPRQSSGTAGPCGCRFQSASRRRGARRASAPAPGPSSPQASR